ncbi:hypothetical protein NC651_008179 [Populus alba x Populus x berolinensis]|nr:hypothetical protein NC651_008179 [Populus alba x Populus x berolinensis]
MMHHYVYDRGFKDPPTITPSMATKLNKTWIFQLRFDDINELPRQQKPPETHVTLEDMIAASSSSATPSAPSPFTPMNIVLPAKARRKLMFNCTP